MERLFISDLDGTLLNDNREISPYSKEIINKFIDEGGNFTVATARTAATVVEILEGINVKYPVVLMNGAMVFDINKETYLKYEVIKKEDVLKITDLAEEYNVDGFLYTYNDEKIIAYFEKLNDNVSEFYNQRKKSDKFKEFSYTESFKNVADKKCVYFAFMDKYEKLEKIYKRLEGIDVAKAFYQDTYDKGFYYLEIFSKDATKGNGVKFLKEYLSAKSTVVFGDNLNDLDMFKLSDVKVAPINAHKKVKEEADYICKSNNDNGVAEFIKSYGG